MCPPLSCPSSYRTQWTPRRSTYHCTSWIARGLTLQTESVQIYLTHELTVLGLAFSKRRLRGSLFPRWRHSCVVRAPCSYHPITIVHADFIPLHLPSVSQSPSSFPLASYHIGALQSISWMPLCLLQPSLALLRAPSTNTSTSGLRGADSATTGVEY